MTPGTSLIAGSLALIMLAASGVDALATRVRQVAETPGGKAPASEPSLLPPLPTPAPDAAEGALAPDAWSASEIADAKRACEAIAAATQARFEILPPRRKGQCGSPAPIRLESIGEEAAVRFVPPPVITCDMVAGLAKWIEDGLKPLGERHLDGTLSEVRVMSSYSCRTRYGQKGARMSEHAFANALDIAGFTFTDGRTIDVLSGWGATKRDLLAAAARVASTVDERSAPPPTSVAGPVEPLTRSRMETETADALPPIPVRRPLKRAVRYTAPSRVAAKKDRRPPRPRKAARAKPQPAAHTDAAPAASSGPARDATRFLRESHRIACTIFGTTLGPEANEAHRNHFHVDMFPRRNRGYCE